MSAWRLLTASLVAVIAFAIAADRASAGAPLKVDNPEILVVAFDYDGLAAPPEVTQISFILYSDGTFALLDHAGEDADAFIQGKLSPGDALDLATGVQADLADIRSDVGRVEDMGTKGGFEVWVWNPADHLYGHPMLTGHPCDAPSALPSVASATGMQSFCRRIHGLRGEDDVTIKPVRTSFIFTKAAKPGADVRPIPATVGARTIDADEPMVGICSDSAASNETMASLIAPNADGAAAYSLGDLPPLELTQIFRATYLPKTYDVPLGDVMQSVGDPCDTIRANSGTE